MLPHILQLKKHSIIMLLRNLDPVNGHCNETPYVIEHLHDHIIDVTIACGPHAGKRIYIHFKNPNNPFRQHFSLSHVRPAFAITANKAQGHTLSHAGIYLKQDFFSHGQLYVAMSHVGPKDSLKIYSGHEVYTSNVVYKGVLHQ